MILNGFNNHVINYFSNNGKKILLLFCLFILSNFFFAQQINCQIIYSLDKINTVPSNISFNNLFEINNKGGHIQGIQFIKHNQSEYFVLTGSSDTHSYFSIVSHGIKNEVLSVNKILDKPFKHAGGFQIYNNLMAVGIEDNNLKDKSKIIIYNLINLEQPRVKKLATIERSGKVKRVTAGCVAIHEIDDHILVIVGDWDTKHLDFYKIKKQKLGLDGENFDLTFSIDTEKIDKTAWIDQNWLSYQNINLFKDASGNIYLAGLTSDAKKNLLDIFEVHTKNLQAFSLVKIYSKKLSMNENSNFRWGAGINMMKNNEIEIISCGAHIEHQSFINIYR